MFKFLLHVAIWCKKKTHFTFIFFNPAATYKKKLTFSVENYFEPFAHMSPLRALVLISLLHPKLIKKFTKGSNSTKDQLILHIFIYQVNGIGTVRVPVSVVPYEDLSASYQRQLKTQMQQQAAADISEAADVEEAAVEAEADKDSMSKVSEAEETAGSAKTSQDTTAPPSDSPKKD